MAGGFIVFGLQTLILKPDEVQSVLNLNSPQKVFLYVEYVMFVLWMKLGKIAFLATFSLPFLRANSVMPLKIQF